MAHEQFGGALAQGHKGIDGGMTPPSRMAARGGRWRSSDNYCLSLPPALPSPYHFLAGLSLSLSPSPTSTRNRTVRPWVPPRAGWGIAGRSCRQSKGSCVFGSACGKTLQRTHFLGASRGEPFCVPIWQGSSLRTRSGTAGSPTKCTLRVLTGSER
jgi:hypothetical protein